MGKCKKIVSDNIFFKKSKYLYKNSQSYHLFIFVIFYWWTRDQKTGGQTLELFCFLFYHYLLFFTILISSYTINILFCNLSSTPGVNLDIVEDKNCTREDEYCQRGDKIVKRRSSKVPKFDPQDCIVILKLIKCLNSLVIFDIHKKERTYKNHNI